MAKAEPSSPLDCPVCSEEFTDPKLLDCNHIVCSKCLVDWLRKTGKDAGCPLCRAAILSPCLPDHDDLQSLVDALPTDQAMVAKVENAQMLGSHHVCMVCDNTAAVAFCLQCNMKLCRVCGKGHTRSPYLKSHLVEELDNMTEERLVEVNRARCKTHDDRPAELYCDNHQKLICTLCVTSDHSDCSKVKVIKDAGKEKREKFRQEAAELRKKETTMRTQIKTMKDSLTDMHANVNKVCDDLRLSVENRRQALHEVIRTEEERAGLSKADQVRATTLSLAGVLDDRVQSAPDDALLDMESAIMSRLRHLEEQASVTDRMQLQASVRFDPQQVAQLKSAIAALGHLMYYTQTQNGDGRDDKTMSRQHHTSQDVDDKLGAVGGTWTGGQDEDFDDYDVELRGTLVGRQRPFSSLLYTGSSSQRLPLSNYGLLNRSVVELSRRHFDIDQRLKLKIYVDDITRTKTDAVVNAVNWELKNIGGVAGALAKAAGPDMEKECEMIYQQRGPLRTAEVVKTRAYGKLNHLKCMVHTMGPIYRKEDSDRCVFELAQTFLNSLLMAEKLNLESLTFPFISTGIFGVPVETCVLALYTALKKYGHDRFKALSNLEEIHFIHKDINVVCNAVLCAEMLAKTETAETCVKRMEDGEKMYSSSVFPFCDRKATPTSRGSKKEERYATWDRSTDKDAAAEEKEERNRSRHRQRSDQGQKAAAAVPMSLPASAQNSSSSSRSRSLSAGRGSM